MSAQSDAAKAHIEKLLKLEYNQVPLSASEMKRNGGCFRNASIRSVQNDMIDGGQKAFKEYYFTRELQARFDYAVPALKVAIEIDGGTFQSKRTGHSSGVGLRVWREKNNAAMTAGWRVWHYSPEEIIKAGRKTLPDEPVLLKLPWT